MKIKAYTDLQGLIDVIKEDEKRILEQYLLAFEKKDREYTPLILVLYNYINHNRYDCATTYKKIEKNNNLKNFNMLCYRLRDKILECFLLDVNINRKGFTSKLGKITVKTNKMLMQAKQVGARGNSTLALFLLDRVILQGKKYELYPVLIEALHLKRSANNLRFGSTKYKKITQEIEFYQNCQGAIFSSKECRNHMQLDAAFSNVASKKIKAFVYYINKIKDLYKQYPSPTLYYDLLWLQMNYHQYNGRYMQSNSYCNQLLKHINEYEYLNKPSSFASITANKAYNAVFLKRFTESYNHIKVAEQYFPKGSFNYLELQVIKFYAHYFSGDYECAYQLATYIQAAKYRKTEFQQSMWNYYLAVCHFNKKEYSHAQELLNQVQELKRDKKGWNLSIRVMNICCSIEQKKLLLADEQLDRLRFYYYKKQGLGARNNAIIKSILWLEDEYNYSKVYDKAKREIDSLQKNKGWYKWDASRTPELFFFDRWFLGKMNGVDYKWEV